MPPQDRRLAGDYALNTARDGWPPTYYRLATLTYTVASTRLDY